MSTSAEAVSSSIKAEKVRGTSYWGLVWERLRRDRMTMFCIGLVIVLILIAIFAPWVAPYGYDEMHTAPPRQPPTWQHWAGTDELGRDILSRLVFSLRNALIVAFVASISAVAVGCVIGAVAGYKGGWIDTVLTGIIDIMYAFPSLLFNIILISVVGRGIPSIILALAFTSWAGVARLVRGQVLSVKNRDFVTAARALGARELRILLNYVIPNSLGPIIVTVTFMVPSAMLSEGALSILGMGIPPPMPSWGNLINVGSVNMRAFPYQLYVPAGTFAAVLLAFTYVGDGMNRAINPRD
jgi:peptide/nickel transport system permease protein